MKYTHVYAHTDIHNQVYIHTHIQASAHYFFGYSSISIVELPIIWGPQDKKMWSSKFDGGKKSERGNVSIQAVNNHDGENVTIDVESKKVAPTWAW